MAAVTAARLEPVNAFPVGDRILIKHYFEGEAVFERLRPYYERNQYRFEVPFDAFDSLRRFLREHDYELSVVDEPEAYWVVVRQYTEHPPDIFAESVYQERTDGYNCFLMKDLEAVDAAVVDGGTRLTETSLSVSTGTLDAFEEPP